MKKLMILLIMLTIGAATLKAQGPPPNPPSSANTGDNLNGPVGSTNGAPIGSGTFLLLTLAAAYAGRKVYVVNIAKIQ